MSNPDLLRYHAIHHDAMTQMRICHPTRVYAKFEPANLDFRGNSDLPAMGASFQVEQLQNGHLDAIDYCEDDVEMRFHSTAEISDDPNPRRRNPCVTAARLTPSPLARSARQTP